MRQLIPLLLIVVALAGCIDSSDIEQDRQARHIGNGATSPDGADPAGPVTLYEYYNGTVTGGNLEVFVISPDQLGDVERWFYVHEGTTEITLDLDAEDEIYMYVMDADCHDLDCATIVATQGGQVTHRVEDPVVGDWEVVFFKQEVGAGEIDYSLTLTKNQMKMHKVEYEPYNGEAVAINAGALVVSPDQLGDVYREFWVHEGTANMTVNVTTNEEIRFVLGQSNPSRDASSEETWFTEDGRLDLEFEDLQVGGWYFIIFAPQDPGVYEPDYLVEVTKTQGG